MTVYLMPEMQTPEEQAAMWRDLLGGHKEYTAAESRTDFAAIKAIYDTDAVTLANKLRAYIAEARDSLVNLVERQAQSGPLSAEFAQSLRLSMGQEFNQAIEKYLLSVWRKNRDAALAELPDKLKMKLQGLRQFAVAFRPTVAADYFHNRALLVRGLVDDELTRNVKLAVFNALKSGTPTNELMGNLKDLFEPWIGTGKIEPSGLSGTEEDIITPPRLENISRTETTIAINEGRNSVADAAEDFVIGFEYSAILDERTTEICQVCDGLKFEKNSRYSQPLTPPNHFQCRSILMFVTTNDDPVDWSSDEDLDAALRLIPPEFR